MRVIIPLVLVAHTAAAATSVDLAVQGTVSPPSCSIALSGKLNIVLGGAIPSGALNQTISTNLADVPAGNLNVTCAGPTLVG